MIVDKLSEMAADTAEAYLVFLDHLRSIYVRAVSHPDLGTPSHRSKVIAEARLRADGFLEDVVGWAETDADEIFKDAHQTTIDELQSATPDEYADAAIEHLSHSVSFLYENVRDQVARDLQKLKSTLNTAMFEVTLAARARRVSKHLAQKEYRVLKTVDINFGFLDRGGRTWQSEKYIRTLWRQTLLSIYNETVLLTLADHGVDSAQVYHVDGKAEVHGMRVALSVTQGVPVYSDIRDEVFHPNANAFLTKEIRDVNA